MFSALATTRSTFFSRTSAGSFCATICLPGRPTMSPRQRMRSAIAIAYSGIVGRHNLRGVAQNSASNIYSQAVAITATHGYILFRRATRLYKGRIHATPHHATARAFRLDSVPPEHWATRRLQHAESGAGRLHIAIHDAEDNERRPDPANENTGGRIRQ